MGTNVEHIAVLLHTTVAAAVNFVRQVQEQLSSPISTYLVRKGLELYLNDNLETPPSPLSLVRYFKQLESEAEDAEWDAMYPEHAAEEDKRILEQMGWTDEDGELRFIATFGHAVGETPWKDPWEVARLSDVWDFVQGLEHEGSRRWEIREICHQQEVSSLVHFTRRDNLDSILQHGLMSKQELAAKRIKNVVFNDERRHDGQPNAICLSITFPNYKMFYRYRQKNESSWVALQLDAAILWELDCAFCHENAASNNVRHIPLEDRKKADYLRGLFLDYRDNSRAQLDIPKNYTTHPQAEVLVLEPIPTRYIQEVHFENTVTRDMKLEAGRRVPWSKFVKDQRYFGPRHDYDHW